MGNKNNEDFLLAILFRLYELKEEGVEEGIEERILEVEEELLQW